MTSSRMLRWINGAPVPVPCLFELPDETVIQPGHGDDGTIGDSKSEYAVFASKERPPDLCGDVLWEES